MEYIRLVVLVTLTSTSTLAQNWPNYPEPGPDIYGDFCAVRRGGCCPGRVDHCTMPILDTVCYCDEFCVRSEADCCPDYSGTCTNEPQPFKKITNNCYHENDLHELGARIKVNCNNCSCVETNMTMEEYNWKCTQKTCIVRDELLSHVNTQPRRFGWKASNYSVFWGMSLDDGIKYRLGTFKPQLLVESMTAIRQRDLSGIPDNFDARTEWPAYIQPVRDQGNCGSSWAFSTASVASDRLALHSQGVYDDPLSTQQILDCHHDYKQKGCEGGHLDRAWWYMKTIGVVSEPCYPYKSDVTRVRGKCLISSATMRFGAIKCPSGPGGARSPVYQVAPPYRILGEEKHIMKEIMKNGPVQALMHVKEDFYLYKRGVYHYSMPTSTHTHNRHQTGYHSVKILGWGTDYSTGSARKYWLCANSWGATWGEEGYFRILRGENESEIESFILGVWGKVNGRELRKHGRYAVSRRQRIAKLRHRLRHRRHSKRHDWHEEA